MSSDSVREILTFGNHKRIQVQSFSLICTDLLSYCFSDSSKQLAGHSNEREKAFQFKLLMPIVINQKGVKGNIQVCKNRFRGTKNVSKFLGLKFQTLIK